MSWTEERVAILSKMWEEGKPASDIAKELGEVTRNAVIGKVHRLGLKGRVTKDKAAATAPAETAAKPKPKVVEVAEAKPVSSKPEPKPAPKPVKESVTEVAPEVETEELENAPAIVPLGRDEVSAEARENAQRIEEQSKRLTLLQLTERTCKWPVGDPATEDFWFCGHPSKAGKPYCEAHVELAFQAPMARRR